MMKRLKQLREKKGLSQRALAELVGVTQQSINKYENHDIEPDIRTLILLADCFDTSVDYLIGCTDFDHRLEQLYSTDLNEEELNLIQKYRQLNNKQRVSIQMVIENYLEKH